VCNSHAALPPSFPPSFPPICLREREILTTEEIKGHPWVGGPVSAALAGEVTLIVTLSVSPSWASSTEAAAAFGG